MKRRRVCMEKGGQPGPWRLFSVRLTAAAAAGGPHQHEHAHAHTRCGTLIDNLLHDKNHIEYNHNKVHTASCCFFHHSSLCSITSPQGHPPLRSLPLPTAHTAHDHCATNRQQHNNYCTHTQPWIVQQNTAEQAIQVTLCDNVTLTLAHIPVQLQRQSSDAPSSKSSSPPTTLLHCPTGTASAPQHV
jgi:hypothetical protein